MLKKLTVLFFTILLFSSSHAYVRLFSPIDAKVMPGESINIGRVQPSETFEVIFARETGIKSVLWDSMQINLPNDSWKYSYDMQDKTFVVRITAPKSAQENIYNLDFTFGNSNNEIAEQKLSVKLGLEKGLIDFRIRKLQDVSVVGGSADFAVSMENKSIAPNRIRISSDLSKAWLLPLIIDLEPKSKKEIRITITPRAIGIKKFYFKFDSLISNEEAGRSYSEITAKPSFSSKFSSSAYGLPFMDLAMLPERLLFASISAFFE